MWGPRHARLLLLAHIEIQGLKISLLRSDGGGNIRRQDSLLSPSFAAFPIYFFFLLNSFSRAAKEPSLALRCHPTLFHFSTNSYRILARDVRDHSRVKLLLFSRYNVRARIMTPMPLVTSGPI